MALAITCLLILLILMIFAFVILFVLNVLTSGFGGIVLVISSLILIGIIASKAILIIRSKKKANKEFQQLCINKLPNAGFTIIELLPATKDDRAVILALDPEGNTWVFLYKITTFKLGKYYIQAAIDLVGRYGATEAGVITNKCFTRKADRYGVDKGILILSYFDWEEQQGKKARTALTEKAEIKKDINSMTGIEFEHYCAYKLRQNGFKKVEVTKSSGDFGADIVASDPTGRICVFQCKRYKANIGNKPVQEAVAAKLHYGATEAGVMTNVRLTNAARQLAFENNVMLFEMID